MLAGINKILVRLAGGPLMEQKKGFSTCGNVYPGIFAL